VSKECHPEIFADELAGIMLGYPTSKLTFAAIRQGGTNGEVAKTNVLTLSISTQVLIDACNLVLNHAKTNQDLILNSASESAGKLISSLQRDTVGATTKTVAASQKKTRVAKAVKGE